MYLDKYSIAKFNNYYYNSTIGDLGMGAKFGPAIAEPPRKGSAQILRSRPRKFQGWPRKPQPALLEMATVAPTRLRRVTELEIIRIIY